MDTMIKINEMSGEKKKQLKIHWNSTELLIALCLIPLGLVYHLINLL